jgi:fatty-acyl-CoA synthase
MFHDMGVVGGLLFSLYWNLEQVLLSPTTFLARPIRWLEAIDRHRGSLSPAPTFAYSYLAHRLRKGAPSALDLSSWRVANCGAEPVRRSAVQGFLDIFARNGLDPGVLVPCYGLAEATLAVTFTPCGRPLRSVLRSRSGLAQDRVCAPTDANDAEELVLLGTALREVEIEIRDRDGAVSGPDAVGVVWLRGPSITPGYYRNEGATAESRDANGWLNTGDLGCWIDGELVLIGRVKDLIIVRGANHSPSPLEWAAETVAGVRKGSVAAFASYDAKNSTEGAVIACEVADDESDWSRGAIGMMVEEAVLRHSGLRLLDVVLLSPGAIPKTTSGKIRRGAVRGLYLQGELNA